MPENSGTVRGVLRRFALGSGPLKRGSDRLQVVARVLLLITLLTAIPIALAAATATYSQGRSLAAAEAASRHQATARLLVDAAAPPDAPDGSSGVMKSTVAWTGPSGAAREGVLIVPPGAKAGSTVTIWTDRDGDVTTRPTTSAKAAADAFDVGLLTFVALSIFATMTYLFFRSRLDRSRLRQWAADWAVVEPVWTRKVP
jgi:hypothetical protein